MKTKSLLASSFVLAMILGLGMACSGKPNDTKISADIQSKFSQDSGLSSKQLTVQSENGVVTLSGNVENDAQRDAASRQAASVPGVKEVVNNLVVGSATATASSTAPPTPAAASPEPAPPEPAKPAPGKKSRRSHRGEDASQATNPTASPDANSNSAQTAAGNPPPPPSSDNTTAAQPAPPPPPPAPKQFIIDQGTQLSIRLVDPIDSEKNQTGDTFHATLNTPLTSDGEQAVAAGADVTGHVVDVKSAGKFQGQSLVVLQLDSLTAGGQTYNLQTDQYRKEGASRGKNTAEKVGGGAILGGIIGALAGGGKGAAIGAAAGAGAGGGVQAASKSQQIKLPSETVLNFTLQAPITVVQSANPNASRPKLDNSQ
ncbi:MAG TPA: BON domain-containing protein [Verrucomicrobiae bacterium]|nr:BON domain-containing protein [Verrucomicrobiae bacterium]